MNRQITSWYSPRLYKEMPIVQYGHWGDALLLLPTAAADFLEYERFMMIKAIAPLINAGKFKVFSIDSINSESWLNNHMHPHDKGVRHGQYNGYITEEVIPFIKSQTSNNTLVFVSGASFGALHSMNLFLKRPDLFAGAICMSGIYDLTYYTKGYWDDNVYFNSPVHHLSNLNQHETLEQIRASHHIHILAGSGDYEDPDASRHFASILYDKGIYYDLDIWGTDMRHDWTTWRKMLPYVLGAKF